MKAIDNYNFKNKKALIRVDFNVPLDKEFNVTDDTRIRGALPTINKITNDGGIAILVSHLGRPKEGPEEKYSLKHLVNHLSKVTGKQVKFVDDCIGQQAVKTCSSAQPGDIILLENLRFYKQEEKGDKDFAKKLADLADVYVNDAFGTAHRAHASTAIVADYFDRNSRMFGYLIESELESIDKMLDNPESPFVAIMGGAKVSGKIMIIERLMDKVNDLVIGGGMSYTFIKALGGKVGSSLVEEDKLELALSILNEAKEKKVNIHLPVDTVIADVFHNEAKVDVCKINAIPDGWLGLDIGPETCKEYAKVLMKAKTILWNGPMGVFEMPNFENGTKEVALSVANATKNGAFSLVGGGDSVAAVNKYDLVDSVSYVSTGGGALLEYIEGQELPGIKAIRGR